MKKKPASDYTTLLLLEQSPEEVFKAINNVRGWWIDEIEGSAEKINDEFSVRFEDIHYSKQKLVEFVPNTKVVWMVIDSKLSFIQDKSEWTGTAISFEVSQKGKKTQLVFTHQGLNPEIECYGDCSNAWEEYIQGSLLPFIMNGEGHPFKVKK